MGQDKKQLTKLLAFVKELYEHPDNKEFAAGIRDIVKNDKDHPVLDDTPSLKRISSYLSLDYELDDKDFPDYSFIDEDPVRESLLADFREMLRYQYGTRSHKIDFPEFCRFGVMQIEMLVNYFFEKNYDSNLDRVVNAIQLTNPRYFPGDYLSQISDIPLKTKVYRIRHELNWDNDTLAPILNAIEVRNRQSHRSLRLDKDMILDYETRFKEGKVWFYRDSVPMYRKAIEQGVVSQDEMNEYKFQVWFDQQPFIELTSSISLLCSSIKRSLSHSK